MFLSKPSLKYFDNECFVNANEVIKTGNINKLHTPNIEITTSYCYFAVPSAYKIIGSFNATTLTTNVNIARVIIKIYNPFLICLSFF